LTSKKNRERTEGDRAVARLRERMTGWLASLRRDVPGFGNEGFRMDGAIPDDDIAAASRLVETASSYVDGQEQPLRYKAELEDDLRVAIAAAEREWSEAQDALSALQILQKEVREANANLSQELSAFRRALGAAIGRSHRDFQKLRVSRGAEPDEEDEEAEGEVHAEALSEADQSLVTADTASDVPAEIGRAP
jgi:hypothetical protein